MKIYLDYVFIINFLFDLILLYGISLVLKRKISKIRLFLGSLLGGVSGFLVLFSFSSFLFFLLKILFGIIIVLIAFSYKNFKYLMNNFFYLVILSILLGGSLYLINEEAAKSSMSAFITNNKIINISILLIIGFLVIIFYSIYIKDKKKEVINKYNTTLYIDNKKINLIGFLDTGNTLLYKNNPVLILNNNININTSNKKIIYIPFNTLNSAGLMKCVEIDKIFIEEKGFFKNVYLALSNDKFYLNDADIILNINLWEDKYEKTNRKTNTRNKSKKK